MAAALLDVNVLIALAWPNHVHHAAARGWFASLVGDWATTPMTEAGFVRVSSNRAAIATASTPEIALGVLKQLTLDPRHRFWPDDVPYVTHDRVGAAVLRSHRDVTDAHLLALALRHGGRLATFDAAVPALAGEHTASVELLTA
jgi:toxin-antitoxin system PIN domain toxin